MNVQAKNRPTSAIKQDYQNGSSYQTSHSNHQYGYLNRSVHTQSNKLKTYESEELRKKNSLKDLKNKRPSASNSFKEESSAYHHYSFSNGVIPNKPSTATLNTTGVPSSINNGGVSSGHLNKF